MIFLGYNGEQGRYEKNQPDSSTTFEILTISCFPHSVLPLCDQRVETRGSWPWVSEQQDLAGTLKRRSLGYPAETETEILPEMDLVSRWSTITRGIHCRVLTCWSHHQKNPGGCQWLFGLKTHRKNWQGDWVPKLATLHIIINLD